MTWRRVLLLSCLLATVLLAAENRQKLRADELRREHFEEQRNESENFVEEQNDEQDERSREAVEQWRQWHYDGLHPPYLYNRHHV
ncbi:PREDICTED: unique cartilage matrix-associated protein [Propithecus coquereli]|uniref:Unique cartilage matrix-associated protein n=1 Tax=Propithecus coquereli TaxID=379532 RepID=A0A2K6F7W0_PROCO|nr:PREDICTED: unique cartilage matrix-associated protein [Propithecus coquereli]